jgi:hypothetical protein
MTYNPNTTSTDITDGTIVNADINASAAITASKISGTAITKSDNAAVASMAGWTSGYWFTNHRVQGQTASMGTAPAEGQEMAVPIMFPFDVSVDRIGVRVGTTPSTSGGSGVVRLGIRNNTNAAGANDNRPGTVLIDGATVATTTADAYINVTISSTTLSAYTLYWLCAIPQGAPATRAQFHYTNSPHLFVSNASQTVNVAPGWLSSGTTSGAMGASFSASIATVGSTNFPLFWLRRV